MSDATIIIIVEIVTAAIITVVGLLVRRDVIGLKPEIQDVRLQLAEANKFIIKQGAEKQALMDELAMRKPVMSDEQFGELYRKDKRQAGEDK